MRCVCTVLASHNVIKALAHGCSCHQTVYMLCWYMCFASEHIYSWAMFSMSSVALELATCFITHKHQAKSLNAPECRVQITKGSAIFMGRVDSCFGWQVDGNEQGEFRTQLLCGGGKPAADQFCRYSFIPQPLAALPAKHCTSCNLTS